MKIMEPKSIVQLASSEPVKKGFFQRLHDALFVIEEPEETPDALPAPIPLAYGAVRAGGTVVTPARLGPRDHSTFSTWRGEPMTPTQYYYEVVPHWWKAKGGELPNVMADRNDRVLGKFDIEEWNDMSEPDRQAEIAEWQKIHALGTLGITMPGPTPIESHERRMARQAKAQQMKREMEAHKRKLEAELAAAQKMEEHYEANSTFGAF